MLMTWAIAGTYMTLLGVLALYGAHRGFLLWALRQNRAMEPQTSDTPHRRVTIQLPIYNEPAVTRRLIDAVAQIEWPADRLQIQVLDDSTDITSAIVDQAVAQWVAKGVGIEVTRRSSRTGYKAGALAHGLQSATGEYIAILDADFVPGTDFLTQLMPHFTQGVGMVQARWGHINRNESWLTRMQAMLLDAHFVIEHAARHQSGRFFNFNGTAGIWRKSCILDAGGWEHDTLTEDLDLSYRAQMKGWRFIYLKDVVTPAELPPDMNGFKSQQHRWAKGSIQTCMKMLGPIWRSKLPRIIKLEATAHLTANFAYLLLILLCVLVNPAMHPESGWVRTFVLDIPIFFATTISVGLFYVTAQIAINPSPLRWLREVCYLPILLALGIGMSVNNGKAVFEALMGKQSDFVRTPKYGIEKKRKDVRKAKYRALRSIAPVFEVAFFFYFSYLVLHALASGNWIGVPFLFLFQVGFFFVAYGSLRHLLPAWILGNSENEDAVLGA